MSAKAKKSEEEPVTKHLLDLLPHKTAEKAKKEKKSAKGGHRGRNIALSVTGALVLLLVAGGGAGYLYFQNRILPGVTVADLNLGGKTKAEAAQLLEAKANQFAVVIQNGATTWKPTPAQLGVTFNVSQTVDQAFDQGRVGSLSDRLGLVSGKRLGLAAHYDKAKTDQFIADIVHATSKPPTDAALTVNGGTITIAPEAWGATTGVEDAPGKVADVIASPGQLVLNVHEIKLEPKIKAANLTVPLQQAQTFAAVPVSVTYNDRVFRPTAAQEAGWLSFAPDPDNHTVKVAVDSAKVSGYVSSIVKSLTINPVTQIIGINQDEGGAQSVVQNGVNGQSVGNQAEILSAIMSALTAVKPVTVAAVVQPVAFASQNMNTYDRWIDINLTTQRMIAYEKSVPVLNVLISSGIPMFPTPTGTYHIYGKSAITEMKGELGTPYAYDLPNVHWVSWWYGDFAIHEAYWHHNFGHPMSHGCINATLADAKFIYDWAPIGTSVVIHT